MPPIYKPATDTRRYTSLIVGFSQPVIPPTTSFFFFLKRQPQWRRLFSDACVLFSYVISYGGAQKGAIPKECSCHSNFVKYEPDRVNSFSQCISFFSKFYLWHYFHPTGSSHFSLLSDKECTLCRCCVCRRHKQAADSPANVFECVCLKVCRAAGIETHEHNTAQKETFLLLLSERESSMYTRLMHLCGTATRWKHLATAIKEAERRASRLHQIFMDSSPPPQRQWRNDLIFFQQYRLYIHTYARNIFILCVLELYNINW